LAETAGICSDLLLWHQGHRLRKSISIFRLLHLEERIGCSASALRELEVQLKEQIIAYGQAQAEAHEQPIGIWVGGDETFYGLPILVAMELASGFIFSEVGENRTYQTWWAQVSEWFNQGQWDCRGGDGEKH